MEISVHTASWTEGINQLKQPLGPAPRAPRGNRHRRFWPPCLALLAFACSGPSPIQRAAAELPDAAAELPDAAAELPDAAAELPDAAGDANANEEGPTWCSVQAILVLKCQRCHGSPPTHGAPFALVTYDDTQVLDRKGNARFSAMAVAVEQETMPAQYLELTPPVEPLQDDERATVLAWCADGGLLTGSAVCDPAP